MPIKIDLDNIMWEKRIKTITELSKESKVSRPTLAKWKNNKVDRIELEVLEKICEALDCDINELLVLKK